MRTITGGMMAGTRTLWYLHPDNAGPWASRARSTARMTPTAASNRPRRPTGALVESVLHQGLDHARRTAHADGGRLPPTRKPDDQGWSTGTSDHLGSLAATTEATHTGASDGPAMPMTLRQAPLPTAAMTRRESGH